MGSVSDHSDLPADLPFSVASTRLIWSRWPAPDASPALLIRPPRRSDLQAVFDIHSDPLVHLHNPNGPDSWEASTRRLASWLDDWHKNSIGYMVVELDGRVVGFTGLRVFPMPNKSVPAPSPLLAEADKYRHIENGVERILNVYYRFSPSVHGRGIAVPAVRLAIEYALDQFPDHQVAILTPTSNTPSRKLAERLGFTYVRDADWAGIPHADYRLLNGSLTPIPETSLPLVVRRLAACDVDEAAKIFHLAFEEQFRAIIPSVPLGEKMTASDEAEITTWRAARLHNVILEEELGLPVRSISVRSRGRVLGLGIWEPSVANAPTRKWSHLTQEERQAHFDKEKAKVDAHHFPSRASREQWAAAVEAMSSRRERTMGKTPHADVRIFCFHPDARNRGLGDTILRWCIRENTEQAWYLDATMRAVPFYKRIGFRETAEPEIEWFNDEQKAALASLDVSEEERDRLRTRLRPMVLHTGSGTN